MSLSRELKELYRQYDAIQGADPLIIGRKLPMRIEQKHYKASTMRQIVGLLQCFVDNYETESHPRNSRYAVCFMFNVHNPEIYGPLLIILDAIEKQCIEVLEWNKGDIQPLGGKFREQYIETATIDYSPAMQQIRDRINAKDAKDGNDVFDRMYDQFHGACENPGEDEDNETLEEEDDEE